MKYLKFTAICILTFIMISCKKENNKVSDVICTTKKTIKIDLKDTIIKDINPKYMGDEILGIQKRPLINKYYLAINREVEKPEIADYFLSYDGGEPFFKISNYKSIPIKGILVKSYLISIQFKNSEYTAILIILDKENYPDNCLVIYENIKSKSTSNFNYICYSEINNSIITINRIGDFKKNIDQYILKQNDFLDYYENSKIDISEWGAKEYVYTKDGLDSTLQYEYIMKGKIKNHLKHGIWEEKRYFLEHYMSIWISSSYTNGIKNGESYFWEGSPYGKTEVYEMGKLIKTN